MTIPLELQAVLYETIATGLQQLLRMNYPVQSQAFQFLYGRFLQDVEQLNSFHKESLQITQTEDDFFRVGLVLERITSSIRFINENNITKRTGLFLEVLQRIESDLNSLSGYYRAPDVVMGSNNGQPEIVEITDSDSEPPAFEKEVDNAIVSQHSPDIDIVPNIDPPIPEVEMAGSENDGMSVDPPILQEVQTVGQVENNELISTETDPPVAETEHQLGTEHGQLPMVLESETVLQSPAFAEEVSVMDKDLDQGLALIQQKKYREGLECFYKAAKRNVPRSLYEIGVLFFYGRGLGRNYSYAVECFSKAAGGGCLKAAGFLSWIYYFGKGVPLDISISKFWADKGTPDEKSEKALYVLGRICLDQGEYSDALPWFQKAADTGSTYAIRFLGSMYEKGLGVPKDKEKAYELYEFSVTQSDFKGHFWLAKVYYGAKDYALALKWLLKAEQGGLDDAVDFLYQNFYGAQNSEVQFALGEAYRNGLGTKKDLMDAKAWYSLAVKNGNTRACLALQTLN